MGGVTGGVFSTLIVHPLDLIKIRFQGVICRSLIAQKLMQKSSQNKKIGSLKW